MSDHDASHKAFFALHHGLPRQGPGSDATTRHLLSLAGPLPARPRVLDLGCGPGRSALLLAAEVTAEVTAVDLHEPFLDELRTAAEARGLTSSIHTVNGDMGELLHPDGSYDLIWAESSAYLIGFDTARLRRPARGPLPAPYVHGTGVVVVRAVPEAACARAARLVLALGRPGSSSYSDAPSYRRLGLPPASVYGIRPGCGGPAEHLTPPALDGSSSVAPGTIRYPAAGGS